MLRQYSLACWHWFCWRRFHRVRLNPNGIWLSWEGSNSVSGAPGGLNTVRMRNQPLSRVSAGLTGIPTATSAAE